MSSAIALPLPTNNTNASILYDKSYYIDHRKSDTLSSSCCSSTSSSSSNNNTTTAKNNNTIIPLHQQQDFFLPTKPMTSSNKHRHQKSRHIRHRPDRRRDAFELLQTIIQENEKREREEYEQMLREVPAVVTRRSSTSQDLPSILIKPPHQHKKMNSSISSVSVPTTPTFQSSFQQNHHNHSCIITTTIEEEQDDLYYQTTPPPSPKRPSVRFAADLLYSSKVPSQPQPPQPQPTTSRTSAVTNKLRSFLHLSSKKVSNL